MKKLVLLFLPFILFSSEIVWVHYNIPPVYILNGKYKGEGYKELAEKEIMSHFKEYNSSIKILPISRVFYEMKHHQNMCTGVLKTNKREEFLYFSKALNILMPNGLIIRSEDYEKVKPYIKNNELNLEKFVKKSNFKIAVLPTRTYGKVIDSVIQKYKNKMLKIYNFKDYLEMLKYKRFDAFFGYPTTIMYNSLIKQFNPDEFRYIKIKGNNFNIGYIACSKSEFSKKFITKINKYIINHRTNSLLKYYLKWLDKNSADCVKKHAKEIFEKVDK